MHKLWSVITGLLISLTCISIAIWSYFDTTNLIAEIFTQARLHLSVIYFLFLLFFLYKKQWFFSIIFIVAIVFNGKLIISGFHTKEKLSEQIEERDSLRVLSFNIYMHNKDIESVYKNILSVNADIVFLVEVSDASQKILLKKIGDRYPYQFPDETTNYLSSIAVFSKYPILSKHLIQKVEGIYKTIVYAPIQFKEQLIHVYGVHMTSPRNSQRIAIRNNQIDKVGAQISEKSQSNEPVIFVGDMNSVPWSRRFLSFLDETGLQNSDRFNSMNLTWPSWLPWPMQIPIDHILHNDAFCYSDSHSLKESSSDHFGIYSDVYWCKK